MAMLDKGTIFRIKYSSNHQGTKPKYFIALNDAEEEDDTIVALVLNTEHYLRELGCHRRRSKYVLDNSTCPFMIDLTSVMTAPEHIFKFGEILEANNRIECTLTDVLFVAIFNCIDFDNFEGHNLRHLK